MYRSRSSVISYFLFALIIICLMLNARLIAPVKAQATEFSQQLHTWPTNLPAQTESHVQLTGNGLGAVLNGIITVTNTNNSGAGSLRQAISDASPGDTIDFSVSGTIVLVTELAISKNLTIDGGNAITVSGNNATRVFNVTAGNVTFDSLAIINGIGTTYDCGQFWDMCGGGIALENSSVTVTVTNSTLSNNSAADNGGGIFNYFGTVTVNNSTLSGNSAGVGGGGIDNFFGTVTVNNSTLSGNSAGFTGGGIENFVGTVTVNNSTLSGNSADSWGGGIYSNSADSDCNATPHTIVRNSTLSGNSAFAGGGIHNQKGLTEISYSTITNNMADIGGGVYSDNGSVTCTRVRSTIIAGNTSDDVAAWESLQRFFSLGYNLIGTAGDSVDFNLEFNQIGDMTDTLPLLGSLANNGGNTQTHALLATSPAIDAIPDGTNGCGITVTADQRGLGRPADGACDIGAVELETNLAPIAANNSYSTTEDVSLAIVVPGVLGNDVDGDGDGLTAVLDSDVTNGTLTFNSDGSFVYTPTLNFNGLDTFVYLASDGTLTDTATVTIVVTAVNDAPVASGDSYSTAKNTSLVRTNPGVLTNDTDPDMDGLTAVLDTPANNGTVSLSSDGSFVYTPNLNFIGVDTFVYLARDGDLADDSATVIITVTAEPSGYTVFLPFVARGN